MDKIAQDTAWACLPKEVRDHIKAEYRSGLNNPQMDKCDSVYLCAFENIFGKHNLESNTEPEEILTVERNKVQGMYPHFNNHNTFNRGVIYALDTLFSDKCLPDKEQAKPKFKVGDKVRFKDTYYKEELHGKIGIVTLLKVDCYVEVDKTILGENVRP